MYKRQPKSVPAGQYAQEIFTNLKNWNDVKKKASFGTNVTEVLNWVAKGSASCGVVYATDAASNKMCIRDSHRHIILKKCRQTARCIQLEDKINGRIFTF